MIDKVPCQNIKAEEALLCAVMMDNKYIEDIGKLEPQDFYNPKHEVIFKAMLCLINDNSPVDLITVGKKIEHIKAEFDLSYLALLVDYAEMSLNVKAHSKIIRECSLIRNLTTKAMRVSEIGFNNPDPEEFVDMFYGLTSDLEIDTDDRILNGEEFANSAMDFIEQSILNKNSDGIQLGFRDIDEIVNIFGSKLILIAARPGIGKTAFMTSIVENICSVNRSVGILEIEMDKEEIGNRFIGKLANINPGKFKFSGNLDSEDLDGIKNACAQISRWDLFIDDSGCTIDDVKRKCRKMKKLGCEVIFIDQLSKITGGKGSQFERYTENCSQIALLKKELRIPIFLLCQINREGAEKPTMSNLKQTGMLEEDADMIFILHRDDLTQNETDVMLVKHRQGGVKDFTLTFNRNRITFNKIYQ